MTKRINLSSLKPETQALIRKELAGEKALLEKFRKIEPFVREKILELEDPSPLLRTHAAAKNNDSFVPTKQMAENAERGLKWRKEYNRGGTNVGVRRAVQLKNQDNLSLDTVKRMHSFFSRHFNHRAKHYDFQEGEPTAWRIAWELWGGDAGKAWAERIADKFRD